MKKHKIAFWVSTSIIFLFDTVMPALTSHTQIAIDGIQHLGYPDYFRIQLTVFKVIGGILLIFPKVPARLKEWAYVGFGINFISAFVAHAAVDGIHGQTFFPLVILGILIVSYVSYHKIKAAETNSIPVVQFQ
ncbi:MAG: DoxX family protein [Bacteroidota bacterium]